MQATITCANTTDPEAINRALEGFIGQGTFVERPTAEPTLVIRADGPEMLQTATWFIAGWIAEETETAATR